MNEFEMITRILDNLENITPAEQSLNDESFYIVRLDKVSNLINELINSESNVASLEVARLKKKLPQIERIKKKLQNPSEEVLLYRAILNKGKTSVVQKDGKNIYILR